MERSTKEQMYFDVADSMLKRSTCLRRRYGAVIVKNDEVVSTGYNGAPRGRTNCTDCNFCLREKLNVPQGERYELCVSVHGEANAIISASRKDMIDSTLYLAGRDAKTGEILQHTEPCSMCKRLIINAGIKEVICREGDEIVKYDVIKDWVENSNNL